MDERFEDAEWKKVEEGGEVKGSPPLPENAGNGLHLVIWAHARLFALRIVRSHFLGDGVTG